MARSGSYVILAGLLATALAAPSTAEEFRWSGRLEPGRTLEVRGVNGDVDARPASGDAVEVVADKRGRRDDPSQVRIEVVEHPGGATLCAIYPGTRRGEPNRCAPGDGGRVGAENNDVSVEWSVRLPAGVRFAGRTINGDVSASELGADVEAESVNGTIRVATAGRARASTVNGSIDARLGVADGREPLSFECVNGGITVELPEGAAAEVDARTVNGSIRSDFPLSMRGRWVAKRATGSIGAGGRELEIETVNGSIELRRR